MQYRLRRRRCHFPTDLSAADKLQIVQLWSELEEGGPRRDDGTAEEKQGRATFVLRSFVGPTDLICGKVTGGEVDVDINISC